MGSKAASRRPGLRTLLTALTFLLPSCAALSPRPVSSESRLAAFPTTGLPLERPVIIRWNAYAIPWVEAESDHDLAFTLGLIQAHLRLGQLAFAKRIVRGRLSEMAGPFTRDLDQLLRTIDFGYAAPAIEAAMPPETKSWMQAFVDGLNWYQGHAAADPPEYGLLGLRNEPWTIADILAIGRLAGTDINWLTDSALLNARLQPDWPQTWNRTLQAGASSSPSFANNVPESALSSLLAGWSHSGSNALAVAPGHSTSGGALMASDPHLGVFLPNFWILVGMKSPSFHTVGLMPVGLPILGLGRNEFIAWSGTNMHAAASELYDVSDEPAGSIQNREEVIQTRLWFDRRVTIRRSPLGPIVSDTTSFPARPGEVIALRWTGYEGSDEITAFLKVMRARSAEEFRRAFQTYGVGGQNMLCATATGDICQVMAVHLPIRSGTMTDLVRRPEDPAAKWHGEADSLSLPWTLNPPGGLLASANNRPTTTSTPVGFFFPPAEREERLYALLRAKDKLALGDLAALQQDTLSTAALALKNALVKMIKADGAGLGRPAFMQSLASWDGRYQADSPGPVAFETLLYHLALSLYAPGGAGTVAPAKSDWKYLLNYLVEDLDALSPQRRFDLLRGAIADAAFDSRRFARWGDMHRMRVGYILANLPVLGPFFTLEDYGADGSRNTVLKTAHGLTNQKHSVGYGSEARQLCDLSDPDANWFVLLGGQDGWLGSRNFADELPLWRENQAIQMPLRPASVAAQFPTVLELKPGSPRS